MRNGWWVWLALVAVVVLIAALLAGCAKPNGKLSPDEITDHLRLTCTGECVLEYESEKHGVIGQTLEGAGKSYEFSPSVP